MGILDNLTKNPSFLLIAGVGVALFVFRDKISNFFSTITGGIEAAATAGEISQGLLTNLQGNLTGTTNALNQLSEDFGSFQEDVGTNFGLIGDQFSQIPDFFSNLFSQNQQDTTPPEFDLTEIEEAAALQALEINRLRSQLENALFDIPADENLSGSEFASATNANEFRARREAELQAALGNRNFNVQTDIEGNTFAGGGVSFVGGTVSQIPVNRLSLSGIIDRFGVSASKAADIRARSRNDFDGFNFGTNTGRAIELLDRSIGVNFGSNFGQTSNDSFARLTPTQIMERILGGNINNF